MTCGSSGTAVGSVVCVVDDASDVAVLDGAAGGIAFVGAGAAGGGEFAGQPTRTTSMGREIRAIRARMAISLGLNGKLSWWQHRRLRQSSRGPVATQIRRDPVIVTANSSWQCLPCGFVALIIPTFASSPT